LPTGLGKRVPGISPLADGSDTRLESVMILCGKVPFTMEPSFGREAVTDALFGEDVSGASRIGFDLAAQRGNEHA
jgi:hypothetical protein